MGCKSANRSRMEIEMIDIDTIEDADECDGEALHVYGRDTTTGQWRWQWVAVETLMEAGRGDLVPWLQE